ncbi:Uncharacterized protein dnl_30660 [Desulfonema limicola]|uniref:Uncharacterized protein n=1 Tax=Desulfonema limicola TaxID=45656 RepID=A0A975B8L4_9BACT|nr:Uncharacterized protein dnl_30660 [Desulfonema limicola]
MLTLEEMFQSLFSWKYNCEQPEHYQLSVLQLVSILVFMEVQL